MNVVRKLPYIVCIIDGLADLMIQARAADVEDAIYPTGPTCPCCRYPPHHRRAPLGGRTHRGHQANFPARISFQVSSKVDSRCILDQIGAERLIGRGDMLHLPAWPIQAHPYPGGLCQR